MPANLRQIAISGLHGRLDIKIPVVDNRLVLVGVNGLGKTTVVNLLYYFLSRQWHRLLEVVFDEIVITLGRRKLRITHQMLEPPKNYYRRLTRILPPSLRQQVGDDPRFFRYLARREFSKIETEFNVPRRYLANRLADFPNSDWQATLFDTTEGTALSDIDNYLERTVDSQILYLPTYRRIEHDLSTLLRHFDDDAREAVSRQLRRHAREHKSFIELVQFGIEDVQSRISERTSFLKERARVELNELAGSYLRDVISGEAERYNKANIESLNEQDVDRILERVEEKTLSVEDKNNLRGVILNIRNTNDQKNTSQGRYLAHFFSKLVDMHRSQQERELPLREFTRVCNKYLQGKKIDFDDVEYNVSITTEDGIEIEMGNLSSGEKQIVSLFSHIYLSNASSFYIIIDEPELSLSVAWQQALLPDLVQSGRCAFLAAVTHSPFIFDNDLEPYAVDLRSCTSLKEK